MLQIKGLFNICQIKIRILVFFSKVIWIKYLFNPLSKSIFDSNRILKIVIELMNNVLRAYKWRQYTQINCDMLRYLTRKSYLKFCTASNPKYFGVASKIGGSSKQGLYQLYAHNFHNNDLMNFKQKVYQTDRLQTEGEYCLPGVNILTTEEQCIKCMEILMRNPEAIAAWDSQTIDLDIKQQAPVGKGKILCATFFAGPQFNFGRGPRVFIDNFGQNAGLINIFKPYLQSQKHRKVWHNYGFDRHLFYNHGINVKGFAGDTMQMARLYDSGKMFHQYSLSSLTAQYAKQIDGISKVFPKVIISKIMTEGIPKNFHNQERRIQLEKMKDNIKEYDQYFLKNFALKKKKMQDLFRRKKILKSGGDGSSYEYPNTLTLHTSMEYIKQWVRYSALDSQTTYYLRYCLKGLLLKDPVKCDQKSLRNMWDIYTKYWLPFGELLTEMQRQGFKIDLEHMKKIESQAQLQLQKKQQGFLQFLKSFQNCPNINHFNPSSALQLQQLLFAPCTIDRSKVNSQKPQPINQQAPMTQQERRDLEDFNQQLISQKQAYQLQNETQKVRAERKTANLSEIKKVFKVDNKFAEKPKKINMQVIGLGLPYEKTTPLGLPSVDISVIQILAGNPEKQKYGTAYKFFEQKDPQFGKKLCEGLKSLIEYRHIETLLKTFIQPLAGYTDQNARIHCSININTQTGRLSCRKPNIQNQPALDKDIYKIRKAFCAEKGKKLIVADYGQLELRVLAHLANCKAMISAFKEGGDFHSRTAIGMYDYIKQQIDEGKVLLEWDKSKGAPPVPLLKDKFAAERKKAKTVNFSIAYGKTAKGFAEDWNCSINQAKQVINSWFKDRPQVQLWQKNKQDIAYFHHKTSTLLGRNRNLNKFFTGNLTSSSRGLWMRRSINTPIQGGAADIVIAAMIKISQNERLKQLGWKLIMQIHDQLILQGPEQSSQQAFKLVKHNMQHPFDQDLRVALEVDAKIGNNWYECK